MNRKVNCWLLFCLISIVFTACNPRESPGIKQLAKQYEAFTTKQTDEAIKTNPALQEVEATCKQIPLPSDFVFEWKGGLNDDQVMALSYYYASETKYGEARLLWNDYFLLNGWVAAKEEDTFPRNLRFKNTQYEVSIYHGGMGTRTQYSIHCEKLAQR